jgi:transcriptional regulator with XRE-family HTH domain
MKSYWYSTDKNLIGPRIREARMRQLPKITQEELAARLRRSSVEVDRIAVSNIESGKRIVVDFEAKAIAEALNVSIAWLFDEVQDS